MKRFGTIGLLTVGFITGIFFVYSCGGGGSAAGVGFLAPVAATGQITSYVTGDDGNLQTGIAWPSPRFTDNSDGTITDNLTGLIWLENANCFSTRTWNQALSDSNGLATGSCGLTDGSAAGDWRLPNVNELASLLDFGQAPRTLPAGYTFTNVQMAPYFTSTTVYINTSTAWTIQFSYGHTYGDSKTDANYVWPVKGGA